MAAGFAGLSRVLLPNVLTDLNLRGEKLMSTLNSLLSSEGTDLYVTGLGSIMNFHCRGEHKRAANVLKILFFELLNRGFYLAPRGLISLSLTVSDKQLTEFVETVGQVIHKHQDLLSL